MKTVDFEPELAGAGAGGGTIALGTPAAAEDAVQARDYWELVWYRFKRDKLAIAGGVFGIVLILLAFVGAPIAASLLGHGPNDIFAAGAGDYKPVGPWTHISTAPYLGASGHFPRTLLILGADGQLGRDMFLRLLYGARASLEVAVLSTFVTVGIGVIMGLLAGYFRGWVDTVVSRLTEMVMVFPALLFLIALRVTIGDTLNGDHLRPSRRRSRHPRARLLDPRLVLPGAHHPRRRALAAREGVHRGGAHDRRQRPADHAVASAAAPRGADHRLLVADRRAERSSPRRGSRSSGSAFRTRRRAGATCSR